MSGAGGSSAGGNAGVGGEAGVGATAGQTAFGGSAGSAANDASGAAGDTGEAGAGGVVFSTQTIEFEARVGSNAFGCDASYDGLGSGASTMRPLDFRFYVYDVALLPVDSSAATVPFVLTPDGTWQTNRVALLDFEDGSGSCIDGTPGVHTRLTGRLPEGEYRGISFKVGLPLDLNHADQATAAPPLNDPTMWWSWAFGYRFMKIEFQSTAAGAQPFYVHLGSTDCKGSNPNAGQVTACARPDEIEVSLPSFELGSGRVRIDYAALIADVDVDVDGGGAPGCMSGADDPECIQVFPKIGLDPTTGVGNAATQRIFSSVQ